MKERLTTYHCGKAVIKDKNKLAEAMEKLAEFEEKEKCGEWLDAIELAKIAIALQSQKWIPCSERLPEKHTAVLATWKSTWYRNATEEIEILILEDNGRWHGSFGDLEQNGSAEVIAWSPLPEPYKE